MSDKQPKNELDYLIRGANDNLVSVGTLYLTLLRSSVWILANKTWDGRTPDPELKTLVMQPEGGASMLPIWTDPAHAAVARERYTEYPHAVQVIGAVMMTQVGSSVGLAINPGGDFQLQVTPEGMDQLRQAFGPLAKPKA